MRVLSWRTQLLAMASATFLGVWAAACNGCRTPGKGDAAVVSSQDVGPPSVRVYVVSDLAGALEPCGCQKDMLGGVDRFASLVAKQKSKAPHSLVATVGPLFFMEPTLHSDRTEQDSWKAEAIANGLRMTGLAAFTPGRNDWAGGSELLRKLQKMTSGDLVAANLKGDEAKGFLNFSLREINGVKVAFIGVSTPITQGSGPSGLTIDNASQALSVTAKEARSKGAQIVIGLAAVENRGVALRAAEAAADLDVLAVGSAQVEGESNDSAKEPKFVGKVLVVQPSNHLTRVVALDFFLRGQGRFADGSGLSQQTEIKDLTGQISDLEKRIAQWEADAQTPKADIDNQKKRLATMQDKLQKLKQPSAPPSGNFYRYELIDIKESLGKDPAAVEAMSSYYKRVNDFNRDKFKDKKAQPPAKGKPFYVGGETCKNCHQASFDHWQKTPHAKAYRTLASAHKEFNLDCVSCHVTGYDKPGGSTVTDVAPLKDVQCEQCHGAGSAHIQDPSANKLSAQVEESVCVACHHAPHTDNFVFKARVEMIKGPGHGRPGANARNAPPKDWKPPVPRFAP